MRSGTTEQEDRPRRLLARKRGGATYYVYRRPDNGKEISLSRDRSAAEDAARELNKLFGVGHVRRRHGAHIAYRANAHRNRGVVDLPLDVQLRLPEYFAVGAIRQENERLQGWAAKRSAGSGNHYLSLRGTSGGKLPTWAQQLYAQTRKNAGARNIAFDLSEEELASIIHRSGGYCELTGVRLRSDPHSTARKRPWMASIDRIDRTAGYTSANCRLVCGAANLAMNVWGEDVLMELARALARKELGVERDRIVEK